MATTKVRVSLWPDREIEVDEAEIPNLRQQGLLLAPEPDPAPPSDSQPAPARGKSSKETA